MTKRLIFIVLVFMSILDSFAQVTGGMEFGMVSKEDFSTEKLEGADTSAAAVVLYSGGEYAMEAKLSSIFSINKTVHRRIKVLKSQGLEYAKVSIPYVRFSSYTERVSNVKANVYMLEGDSLVVYKMDRSAVKDLKEGFSNRRKEFEIPNAQVGCILEYTYQVTGSIPQFYESSASGLLSDIQVFSGADNTLLGTGVIFPKWYFQEKIPVVKSVLHFRNFDEYKFAQILQGEDKVKKESTEGQMYRVKKKLQYSKWDFSISTGTDKTMLGARGGMEWLTSPFEEKLRNHMIFSAENLPAIGGAEKYVINPDKYSASVEFSFQGKDSQTNGMQNSIMGWADVDNTFHNRSTFSRKLFFAQNFYKDTVDVIMAKPLTDVQKVESISRLIKGDIECTSFGKGPYISSLKDVYKKKKGSDMEINALAYVAFKGAGYKTDFIMLKSRDKGALQPGEYSVNAMNAAVVRVVLNDGTRLYFDPRDTRDDVNMFSYLNLVKDGRVFGQGAVFDDLTKVLENRQLHSAVLNVDEKGMLTGKVSTVAVNHSCYGMLEQVRESVTEEEYFRKLGERTNGELVSGRIVQIDTVNHMFRQEFHFRRNTSIMLDDRIFVNPFAEIYCKKEDFHATYREFPVEFIFPDIIEYSVNLTVPHGYEIAELPVNESFVLSKSGASVSIRAKGHGNIVMLGLTIRRDNAYIPVGQYAAFREFWMQVCELFDEMIVLKKKGSGSGFDNKRISV